MTPLHRPAIQEPREQIDDPRVLVLGDLTLDEFSRDTCAQLDPEVVPWIAQHRRRKHRLGGAANVCQIVRNLDAAVTCAGVTGNDAVGWQLRRQLNVHDISDRLVIIDPTRPTIFRRRTVTRDQAFAPNPVLHVGQESLGPLSLALQTRLLAQLRENVGLHDALIITDRSSDLFQDSLLRDVFTHAQHHSIPIVISVHGNHELYRYREATLAQLNRWEVELVTGKPIQTPRDALRIGTQICQQYHIGTAAITLEHDGLALADSKGNGRVLPTLPAYTTAQSGIDDKVLAIMGVCLASHAEASFDTQLANLATGLEATSQQPSRGPDATLRNKSATKSIKHRPKILSVPDLIQKLSQHRKVGQKIVFTNGCFELLHAGHIACLTEAASLGDVLVAGMNSNSSVRQLKGPDRPRIGEGQRAATLAALEVVDYVTIFDEITPLTLLSELRPDLLVKGGTYSLDEVVGKEVVESYGGMVTTTGTVDGISTTRILEKMHRLKSESAQDPTDSLSTNSIGVLERRHELAPTCCEQLTQPVSRGLLGTYRTNESGKVSRV